MNQSDSQIHKVSISEEDRSNYKRLDHFLCDNIPELSRSIIKSLFTKNLITSDYQKLELKKMPQSNCVITIEVPPPAPSSAIAQDIPLDILYEDEHLIIVNKAVGMVVHPAPGHPDGTLVNAIVHHCKDLTGVGDELRPGIVHRLDKGTSGIMVVAKNQKTHEGLVNLFSTHDIIRQYQAIVMKTRLEASGEIEATIGRHPVSRQKMAANVKNSRYAKTYYKVEEFFNRASHVFCTLETGRTHQIRVHLSQILGAPILMDPLYGSPKDHLKRVPTIVKPLLAKYEHPLLHARKLGFIHPITKEELLFTAEPPSIFSQTLELLRQDCR